MLHDCFSILEQKVSFTFRHFNQFGAKPPFYERNTRSCFPVDEGVEWLFPMLPFVFYGALPPLHQFTLLTQQANAGQNFNFVLLNRKIFHIQF